jgi:hypothetical protein
VAIGYSTNVSGLIYMLKHSNNTCMYKEQIYHCRDCAPDQDQLYSLCFDPTRDRTHALPHYNPLKCTITCSFLEMITVSIKEKQNSIKILHN